MSGNYADYRECHVEPDWLLIYRQSGNDKTILKGYWIEQNRKKTTA
ncbi:MAG: type II toxin-antitoxin system YafQ family toxin [Blautia sp.]|nr:type II toxin-antitoxin system YafQ family toxin [Blautia sp.]